MKRTVCLSALALTACGCTVFGDAGYTCLNSEEDHRDPVTGLPDPCREKVRDAAPPDCPGECVPYGPWGGGWTREPALVWIGPYDEVSPCPDRAKTIGWEGYAGLVAPPICDPCMCEAPMGSCALSSQIRAHTAACLNGGGVVTLFDAPVNWSGSCTPANGIPAGQLCGGTPCVQSVTIEPLPMAQTDCKPVKVGMPRYEPTRWQDIARACVGEAHPPCLDSSFFCAPTSEPPPPGFRQCVRNTGFRECPADYPIPHVFYEKVADSRKCTECTCGSPTGSMCTASYRFYGDMTCGTQHSQVTATSEKQACVDTAPGEALLSKQADSPEFVPGTCAPAGGEQEGTIVPILPSTVCCR